MQKRKLWFTALLLCLTMLPTAKAFSDISDERTAESAEVLQLLGVVDGVGNDCFAPQQTLTRAQFGKMAVILQTNGKVSGLAPSTTIFPDVRTEHWAAGYLHTAVKEKLLSGYPDGKFHPEETICFDQTVTILLRMLGYEDSDIGTVWPQDYLRKAEEIGLTTGFALQAKDTITRGEAVQLFCRLLATEHKNGARFLSHLGTVQENMILLSVDTTDGTGCEVSVQDGTVYTVKKNSVSENLIGRRGSLVLDTAGYVRTFLPDANGRREQIILQKAEAGGLTDKQGNYYRIPTTTTCYVKGEEASYNTAFYQFKAGERVTLTYAENGTLSYLWAGLVPTEKAVVLQQNGNASALQQLTKASNLPIFKNGTAVSAESLQKYDVASYDAVTQSIRVSDLRLSGYYQQAEPSFLSPETVTIMGVTLPVLESGVESLSAFAMGEQVTLLLTEDFQVAGAVSPQLVSGNAMGIVKEISSDSATVELLQGLTVQGTPIADASRLYRYAGQLVEVSSQKKGLSLELLEDKQNRDSLSVSQRKLGKLAIADTVRIFETVVGSPLVERHWADIPQKTIPSGQIAYFSTNGKGEVDLLVLDDVTGDSYQYGQFKVTATSYEIDSESGERIKTGTNSVQLLSGKDNASPVIYGATGYRNRDFGGLVLTQRQDGQYQIEAVAKLTALKGISSNAWDGIEQITVQGVSYPISEQVVCYYQPTETWISLQQARAYADTATLYYDSVGEKIRIIVIEA